MRTLSIFAVLVFLASCTSMSSLKPPQQNQYFVLESDYTFSNQRGLLNQTWVQGLRKGTYKLVGEDDTSLYFAGEGDSVIWLSEERAEKYLKTGEITPYSERSRVQAASGGSGGIVLSKPGNDQKPKLFYEVRNTTNGANLGITGMAIVSLSEGSLGYIPFDQPDVYERIKVITK